ncbi:lipopolysaccharide export system protein LptC [Andreprevotia lacus DSM 23236]|jgi:lipopolysaccharide export system protein LptC|uniref:Lipopolysaccharide export system protein LptC n=1 Tax=Andreprevotia lacus DSM 23236 TaxID=1121001 RepID=A0A1W1XSC1_9NEIS|nr:LPS export ABC transporter periplasmic protein LptC [Andreprevotia lacus]SMC26870.1 lipopolysaccharide export system protein LptC [Andreprevotia lacus DSM 23236]
MLGTTRILPVALLIMLGGLVWVLNDAANLPALARQAKPYEADLIASRAVSVRFGVDGQPLARLTADRMRHLPEGDTIWLDQPHLRYTAPGQPELIVVSPQARSEQKGSRIWFPGTVALQRAAPPGGESLTVNGSAVWLDTNKDFAWSADPVRADSKSYHVSGVGFEADMKQQTLFLKSNVVGVYEAKRR